MKIVSLIKISYILVLIMCNISCQGSMVVNGTQCVDQDGDLRGKNCALGTDCNDSNSELYQIIMAYPDMDGDSFGAGLMEEVCSGNELPKNYSIVNGDCADNDSFINPACSEQCHDGIDNNCDGATDSGTSECDDAVSDDTNTDDANTDDANTDDANSDDCSGNDCPTVPLTCGNNSTEAGETCDGADVNNYNCNSVVAGFRSGSLACKANCLEYDVSACIPGDIVYADSCSLTIVQAAIDSAQSGDIIAVPAGNCTWEGDLTISTRVLLQGAGINETVITNGSGTTLAIETGISGARVTGFTLNDIRINVDASSGFRIDHNKLYSASAGVAYIQVSNNSGIPYAQSEGLIDNNSMHNGRIVVLGGPMSAHTQWMLPLSYGTADNVVYIENNEFIRSDSGMGNCIDANYGGAYVFRYNTIREAEGGEGSYNLMTHSIQGDHRATRYWEVYGNSIDDTYTNAVAAPLFFRAGTGVIFGNQITNYPSWHSGVFFDNKRSFSSYVGSGICDGSNCWDGNSDITGYPCRDQIGRGPDNVLWDQSTCGAYTQPLMPAYVFINRDQSNEEVPVVVSDSGACTDHIVANRDYYEYTDVFTGNLGVGIGLPADLPSTCTKGVSYWASEQSFSNLSQKTGVQPSEPFEGVLYKCTETNTWTEYFKPYPYPHPLAKIGP